MWGGPVTLARRGQKPGLGTMAMVKGNGMFMNRTGKPWKLNKRRRGN